MDALQQRCQTTIIYFSARPRELGFDTFLYLGYSEQHLFGTFEELCEHADARLCEARGLDAGEPSPGSPFVPAM